MKRAFFVFFIAMLPAAVLAGPVQPPVPSAWVDKSREERIRIVESWYRLPETTRPPFPAFRDPALARPPTSKSQTQNR